MMHLALKNLSQNRGVVAWGQVFLNRNAKTKVLFSQLETLFRIMHKWFQSCKIFNVFSRNRTKWGFLLARKRKKATKGTTKTLSQQKMFVFLTSKPFNVLTASFFQPFLSSLASFTPTAHFIWTDKILHQRKRVNPFTFLCLTSLGTNKTSSLWRGRIRETDDKIRRQFLRKISSVFQILWKWAH